MHHACRGNISIHAPQWGATIHCVGECLRVVISIHAPQWGATHIEHKVICRDYRFQSTHPSGVRPRRASTRTLPTYFNPRTPVGCDELASQQLAFGVEISIHAPQWGATVKVDWPRLMLEFQSTHPSGVRHIRCVMLPVPSLFQSTHPSGVRPARCLVDPWHKFDFNPRTPVGCDENGVDSAQMRLIFQSTHPSGVRRTVFDHLRHGIRISIHAPQWGAT